MEADVIAVQVDGRDELNRPEGHVRFRFGVFTLTRYLRADDFAVACECLASADKLCRFNAKTVDCDGRIFIAPDSGIANLELTDAPVQLKFAFQRKQARQDAF